MEFELPHADDLEADPLLEEEEADGDAAPEEEEDLLLGTGDKPGMARWVEALSSRKFSSLGNACIGQWLPDERLVVLVQRRGKRFATMGFSRDGSAFLHPEEALWLLDQGHLYLLKEDAYWELPDDEAAEEEEGAGGVLQYAGWAAVAGVVALAAYAAVRSFKKN